MKKGKIIHYTTNTSLMMLGRGHLDRAVALTLVQINVHLLPVLSLATVTATTKICHTVIIAVIQPTREILRLLLTLKQL